MKKDKAIEFLRYLHKLEGNHRDNLITFEVALVLEKVRFEFIAAYSEE